MKRGVERMLSEARAATRALLPAACVCLGLLLATTLGTGADEAKASKAKAPRTAPVQSKNGAYGAKHSRSHQYPAAPIV